ncbi:putative regulator of v-atpase-like protein [Phaeoacremonium minimum UCRPA7]|uniref:Putative regulator of v-atpase-like protein n=1 Tax=Phaeoacremonium minimum (strain UCR-PA7) TaxID=1286976 RepID=R8BAG7_PHAM7|nr:putative regulator of v-atpase-like protein [Phaeoacremonium minimum UCRPA7]EON96277.1 putative regulator of v-atpase-like protein [Phaeoacremonium minimum UCRPA7]
MENSVRSVTKKWSAAALEAETTGQNLYETAVAMDRIHLAATFFESARSAVKQTKEQKDTADSIFQRETTPTVLAHWEEETSVLQRLRRWSDLGAFYSGVKDQFDHWRVNAKRARKQRLGDLYRAFRFQYKLDMVRDCLDLWREATASAITSTWDADDIKASHDRSVVEESLQVWQNELSFVEFSTQVAVEADQEAYLMAWQAEHAAMKEAEIDAQEYDAGQTLNEHWEYWVLATLQQRSRHPTVVEMQGHNAKRLRRQALTLWIEQTFPNREPEVDFRASRRSARFITPARNRNFIDYSTYSFRPPSELNFDEHDEGPSFEDSRL